MSKKILFFSVNRHQKQYFDSLLSSIKSTDQGVSFHKRQLLSVIPLFSFNKEEISLIGEVNLIRKQYYKNKNGHNPSALILMTYFFSSMLFLLKIKKLLIINNFDFVVLWNDMKWHQVIVKKLAAKQGLKTAFFENGTLPNTVTFDAKGVNFNNSVPKERSYYVGGAVKNLAIMELPTSRSAYIFVPFQVDYDTQIISHSPWIQDMDEFYRVLQNLVRKLPENIKIYVKEHPASSRCYQYLHSRDSRIEFKNSMETESLMNNAEMVITINSTVGLESIIKNKPVISLGNAFYSIEGLCQRANSEIELIEKVKNYSYPDENVIQNFMDYLSSDYYVVGNWKSPTQEHIDAIQSRLYEYIEKS
jgi:capsular polysaccharide export protein